MLEGGQIDPASKRLDFGIKDADPTMAEQELLRNPATMSVALHELTHFHSLTNDLGTVLTARGVLASLSLERLYAGLGAGEADVDSMLKLYLRLRGGYKAMLEAWRPLLEGLAIYSQTAYPCTELDLLTMPVQNVMAIGSMLDTLDLSRIPQLVNLNSVPLLAAAYEAEKSGPTLAIDSTHSLASALETKPTTSISGATDWLVYFLGHAYVRGLQARIKRSVPEYDCPEHFLALMFKIIQQSARSLIGRQARWDAAPDIERLCGWLEQFASAPQNRIQAIRGLGPREDILTWIRDGQHQTIEWLRGSRLLPLLAELLPEESAVIEREEELKALIVGVVPQTFAVNISTSGTCQVIGKIPAVDGSAYVALRVANCVWWLASDEASLRRLQLDATTVPVLARDMMAQGERLNGLHPIGALIVDCFLTQLPSPSDEAILSQMISGDPDLGSDPTNRELASGWAASKFLFRFSRPESPKSAVLGQLIRDPVQQRAVLGLPTIGVATSLADAADDFDAAEYYRERASGAVADLDRLASYLDDHRQPALATLARTAGKSERETLAKQRQLWCSRILTGLIGNQWEASARAMIESDRMGAILIDTPRFHDLLTASYSVPAVLVGPGLDYTRVLTESVNDEARKVIGKPVFVWDAPDRVRYVGLWE